MTNERLRPRRNWLLAGFVLGGLGVLLFTAIVAPYWSWLPIAWFFFIGYKVMNLRCENCRHPVHMRYNPRSRAVPFATSTGLMPDRCPRCGVEIP
jgi:hypothetical protein